MNLLERFLKSFNIYNEFIYEYKGGCLKNYSIDDIYNTFHGLSIERAINMKEPETFTTEEWTMYNEAFIKYYCGFQVNEINDFLIT